MQDVDVFSAVSPIAAGGLGTESSSPSEEDVDMAELLGNGDDYDDDDDDEGGFVEVSRAECS